MKTGPLQALAGIVAITVVVLVASTITYYAIERPGRDLLGGKRKPKSPVVAPATTVATP